MAGWLHGVFVVEWLFIFPLCGFSFSLFCNYKSAPTNKKTPMRTVPTAVPHAKPHCIPNTATNNALNTSCVHCHRYSYGMYKR